MFDQCKYNFKQSLFVLLQEIYNRYLEMSKDEASLSEDENYFLKVTNKVLLIINRNQKFKNEL